MDWKTLQADLRRLTTLLDAWAQSDEIPAVERDLALEKLRNLYEAIRFAGSEPTLSETSPQPAPEVTVPEVTAPEMPAPGLSGEKLSESLDLGAVLSLDGFSDFGEPAGPIFVEPAAALAPESSEASVASEPEPAPVEEPEPAVASEPELAPVEEPASEGESEPAVAAEPEPVPAEESGAKEPSEPVATSEPAETPAAESEAAVASEPEPAPVEEPASEGESEPAVAAEAEPAETPAAESEVAVASDPESVPAEESGAKEISEPAATPEPEPASAKSRHASPTLFGLEDEEEARHRHKQRVIMSLYGPSPETEIVSVASRHSDHSGHKSVATSPVAETGSDFIEVTLSPSDRTEPETVDMNKETAGTAPETTAPETAASEASVPGASASSPAEPAPQRNDAASDARFETTLTRELIPQAPAPEAPAADADDTPDAAEEEFEPTLSEITIPAEAAAQGPEHEHEHDHPEAKRPVWDCEPDTAPSAVPGGTVLGEVINHNVQTLADTIAPPRDVASELRRNEPVTDLRRAIGLNDKFLLIRDLFGGDGEAFERAIETLNGFEDLDDCMIFIAEHYAWNPNSDGAKLLMELLERKFA